MRYNRKKQKKIPVIPAVIFLRPTTRKIYKRPHRCADETAFSTRDHPLKFTIGRHFFFFGRIFVRRERERDSERKRKRERKREIEIEKQKSTRLSIKPIPFLALRSEFNNRRDFAV